MQDEKAESEEDTMDNQGNEKGSKIKETVELQGIMRV